MKRSAIATVLFAATLGMCAAHARAATEFCPAELAGPYKKQDAKDTVLHYYHLRALSPRTIQGTILADTDHGWFTWTQQPVALTRTTLTVRTPTYTMRYIAAVSPELSVAFPVAVDVNRAWLATAASRGDTLFG